MSSAREREIPHTPARWSKEMHARPNDEQQTGSQRARRLYYDTGKVRLRPTRYSHTSSATEPPFVLRASEDGVTWSVWYV